MQINYSILEPRADELLIPLARDKGAAIVTNRPFGNGGYFRRVRGKTLPEWAKDFDCDSWAQFTLKWILGNPDITCAIPATSNAGHMLDNSRAGYGRLPDQTQRRRARGRTGRGNQVPPRAATIRWLCTSVPGCGSEFHRRLLRDEPRLHSRNQGSLGRHDEEARPSLLRNRYR